MLPEKGGRGKYLFLPGIKGRVANNATFADTWSTKDKIYLLDAIEMKGQDIDWNDVSKKMKEITNHPSDEEWLAPHSCSRQYQGIMDTVGRIVKKEKDKSLLHIVREHYVQEYLKELKSLADEYRKDCIKLYINVKKAKGEEYDERMEIEEVPPPIIEDTSNAENIHKKEQGINMQGTEEEDEDLADLMSILPDGLEFDGDEIDTSIMDTTAFDIASPTDNSPAMKKALDASPKVSPQLKNLAMAHQTSSSLKNLVRSAIAGTSEDGPRSALSSPGSSSAPTLSMLLEMPPRDPGMPLPEISAMSSKQTDQNMSPQKLDSSLFSTLKSPQSLAALDQLNSINKSKFSSNLILKTPEKVHPEGQSSSISPNKSSSPTLKRLLEGNTLSAKDESMAQPSPSLKMTDTTSVLMEVEIKKEQDQDFGVQYQQQQQQSGTNVSSKASATIMSNNNNNSVMTSPDLEIKKEENENLTCSNQISVEPSSNSTKIVSQLSKNMQVDNKSTTTIITANTLDSSKLIKNLEEYKGVSEQNDLKGDTSQLIQKTSPTSDSSVEGTTTTSRLPADFKDKVSNLKDLVVIPGSSPIKTSPTSSVNNTHHENVTNPSISDVSTLSSPLKSSSGDWTSVKDKSNISVSQSNESSKKLLLGDENKSYTLKSENVSSFNKDKSTVDEHGNKVENAPKLEPSIALSRDGQKSDTVTRDDDLNHGHSKLLNIDNNGSGGMPNISKRDSDEEEGEGEREEGNESPRKKVLYPSKTYSRKERERYETEPMEIDDDSSNSAFESSKGVSYSPSRSSPSRGLKRHGTDGKPERRGRKPGSSSESRTSENLEEDGRVTRARARPSPVSSPSKQAINTASPMKPLITSTPLNTRSHTPELEGKSIATRSRTISATSSTSSTLPGSSISIEGVEPISKDSDATKTTQLTPASTTTSISRKLKSDHETSTSETLETPVVSISRGRGRPPMSSLNQRSLDLLPGSSRIDSNPSSPSSTTTSSTNMEEDKEQRTFRRNIAIVLDQIKSHKYASIFLKPTTAPSYLEVVKKPMDISTIRKNIDSGQIRNIVGFERDILLMFVNAITYNSETSETYRMAKFMEADVRNILNSYKITQGLLPQRSVDQETWNDSDSSTVAAASSSTVTKPPEKRRGRPRLKDRPKPKEEPSAGESGANSECDEPEQVERGRKKESSPDIVDVIPGGEGKGRRGRVSVSRPRNSTSSSTDGSTRRRPSSPTL